MIEFMNLKTAMESIMFITCWLVLAAFFHDVFQTIFTKFCNCYLEKIAGILINCSFPAIGSDVPPGV
jgi:hypothetical protein